MTTTRFTNPVRDPVDPDREQEIAERKGDQRREDDIEKQMEVAVAYAKHVDNFLRKVFPT